MIDEQKYLYFEDMPEDERCNLKKIDEKQELWVELYINTKTKRLWAIDMYDKYQYQIAVNVDNIENWLKYDHEEINKKLIIKFRGGEGKEKCIWENCSKKRINGVVYCIDHLYGMGIRK